MRAKNLVNALEEVAKSDPLKGLISGGVDATLAGTFRARDLENAFRQIGRDQEAKIEQDRMQREIAEFRKNNPIGLRNRLSTRETLRPSPDETKQIERDARRARGEGLGQAEMIGLTKSLVEIGEAQLERPTISLDPAGFN